MQKRKEVIRMVICLDCAMQSKAAFADFSGRAEIVCCESFVCQSVCLIVVFGFGFCAYSTVSLVSFVGLVQVNQIAGSVLVLVSARAVVL